MESGQGNENKPNQLMNLPLLIHLVEQNSKLINDTWVPYIASIYNKFIEEHVQPDHALELTKMIFHHFHPPLNSQQKE